MRKYAITLFKVTTAGRTYYLALERHTDGDSWSNPTPIDNFSEFEKIPEVISNFKESISGDLENVFFTEVSFENEADEDDYFEMCGLIP